MSPAYAYLAFLLTGTALATGSFPDCTSEPLKHNKDRASALINLFTLQEKINNTGNVAPGVPRLGVPPYNWWQEALHGVAESPGVNFSNNGDFSHATSFPQPILMGAAFDDTLINEVASIVSIEARAFNNYGRAGLDYWTPNINPYRDPRWGRGQETPGEDPFHLSSYVKALIDGLQGGYDPKYKRVVATCKHFAGYDLESWHGNLRYEFDAEINTQDLAAYYTPSFEACARDSNVGSFMCTYSALSGVPTCADPWLLQSLLREHWNWTSPEKYVTSDCDSIQNIYAPHHFAETPAAAVAAALKAGTDLDCGQYYQLHLPTAHDQGLVEESDIDKALVRQYTALVSLGYFDPPANQPYRSLTFSAVNTPQAQQLAYKAAVEGMTLIKNDGLFPLSLPPPDSLPYGREAGKNLTIALIGDWANATSQMQGNYHGVAPYLHSPLYALSNLPGVGIKFATGLGGQGDPTTNSWIPAFQAVNASDIFLYAGGLDNSVEAEGMDREPIAWTDIQLDLIASLAAMGKPSAVLQFGTMLDNTPLLQNPNISAIMWGGYPGQAGGDALADLIFNLNGAAPAGRLPVTQYPANFTSVPMTDMNIRPDGNLNPGRTYKWFNGTAVRPFGFGMHYVNFTASASLDNQKAMNTETLVSSCSGVAYLDQCPFANVSVRATNAGNRNITSDYSVLAFLSTTDAGPAPYPTKELVAYTRLHNITMGETKGAELPLTLGSLARWDDAGRRILYPGTYTVTIDTTPALACVEFTLTGAMQVLEKWPERPSRG